MNFNYVVANILFEDFWCKTYCSNLHKINRLRSEEELCGCMEDCKEMMLLQLKLLDMN